MSESGQRWRFLVCLIIWYDSMFQVNIISKVLQSPSMCLDDQTTQVEAGMKFISEYRDEGLVSAEVTARVGRRPGGWSIISGTMKKEEDAIVFLRSFWRIWPTNRRKTFQTTVLLFPDRWTQPSAVFKSVSMRWRLSSQTSDFLCGLTCMQESVDMKTLASHCDHLVNGPAAGDISAYTITSFVGFDSTRNLHGLSAIQCLSYVHKRSLNRWPLSEPISCTQNINISPCYCCIVWKKFFFRKWNLLRH